MAAHGAGGASIPENFSGWVDPFVGTSATGHTFPAACVPFGLVQAGPDTIGADGLWWHYCSGYRYEDGRIVGCSQTHLNGTGGIDLGDLLVLPFTGEVGNDNYSSKFRNVTEQASPSSGMLCSRSSRWKQGERRRSQSRATEGRFSSGWTANFKRKRHCRRFAHTATLRQ